MEQFVLFLRSRSATSNAVRVSVMVVGIVLALVGLPLRQFLLALLIAVLLLAIVGMLILSTYSWGPTPPPPPG
jgi:hypothetical protein